MNYAIRIKTMKVLYTFFLVNTFLSLGAQPVDSITPRLETIVVKAFEQQRPLDAVPAAVHHLNRQALERFAPASIVHAINTLPGVRMEERSPGSYRVNIRGSSLRSPFGVRNLKVYYNDLPFTDPGGQTYLNNLGPHNFSSIEIIKGPGSSVYGAGTGGVLLIENTGRNEAPGLGVEFSAGSFGLRTAVASATIGGDNSVNKISIQRQQSEGFRYHSALQRNVLSWTGQFGNGDHLLKTTFLYSDLFYETPGALTLAEYRRNSRSFRPAGGAFPSAEGARAAIYQKMFLAGLSYHHQFSPRLSNKTAAYGNFTELRNPAIRNWGKNSEPHVGGRTSFRYQEKGLVLVAGGEWQQGFNTISVYKNKNGLPDSLQTEDEIPIRQALAFVQASYDYRGWELTAGGSLNFLLVKIRRAFPAPGREQSRDISNQFSPRVALSKKVGKFFLYSSVSAGFSPPTSAELLPSGSAINLGLSPERGTNFDLGTRGRFGKWDLDVNTFVFSLDNTIVQRRDAGGGDYFINAGKTKQFGAETAIGYRLPAVLTLSGQSRAWLSHTYHRFRYSNFAQLSNDFSGKQLPGSPQHSLSAGVDIATQGGWTGNVGYFFSDRMPLNDANTEYADAYHLFHARIGYQSGLGSHWQARLVLGAENLFDATYSLGNDVNGFGGRYYNAAPGRTFYITVAFAYLSKER
jgi:iron complex outermembrane receptor protein